MPTYVYECRDCGRVIEAEQRISEEPLRDCGCGAEGSLKRVIQPTAVMFKGSGFYVNDSGPKAAGEKPAAEKPADSVPSAAG
jgi:putative FmdB family regulatory protein